jgi:hypothetical protein
MIGAFSFQKSRYHALQCDALGIVLKDAVSVPENLWITETVSIQIGFPLCYLFNP